MQLRIGTRNSRLALAQTEILRRRLTAAFPSDSCEIVPIVTTGDKSARPLAEIGGKALFTKELEEALLAHAIDIAVHSLKDMESHLPEGLAIGAVLPREDPRDALISRYGLTLGALPRGARIGTSSPRRAAQLAIVRPDLVIVPFRGNVTTRLSKLKAGEVDATLLALAGLKRLGLESEISEILDVEHFMPAAGQGTIAIEYRVDNTTLSSRLSALDDPVTHAATLAERSLLNAIGGSCRTPIGAYAQVEPGRLHLAAMIAKPDASAHIRVTREGDPGDAQALGKDAGEELLKRGAKDWL